ncbi:MAG: DUF2268 domain-containing putative Zn-dependent protease [Bacteroidetes bacterium]|nr:DUF2268 domain-containing putative Zn-dependent protease [Bacteroidota bacterium]MCL2302717.1 DUF2268 domain-containing putative Zn-dependent protease [Lentimicrobiaceae bacterium]
MKLPRRNFWIIIAIFVLLSAVFFLFFAKNNTPKNNIPLSELKEAKKQLNIQILRYDEDLFSLDMNNLEKEIERLSKIYPPLLIEPNIWNDPVRMEGLRAYLQDTVIIALHEATEKAIKTDIILRELKPAFGYYKVFYPNDSIPVIITMLPGLDLSVPSTYIYDDVLFVNVDMYLGADNPYYKAIGMPVYIAERCEPVYLPVDIFKKAIVHKHLARAPRTTLLDVMITEGKKLYFTEMMFPDLHERYIIGYSEEKYHWANHFLGNAWSYLIEKNELFGKGEALIRAYIEEAPFIKSFGNDSPGRMGAFIGWKLIQSYMANHPEVTLPELMEEVDYQKILNASKFKPQPK